VKAIEHNERLKTAYREAKEVEIALNVDAKIGFRDGIAHCVSLTFAEVGDAIVAALKQRIATMKANLRDLGVE
jgi:hypothetical protein